jgi:ribosome-binding protein aMBF1 (putative translation factor)
MARIYRKTESSTEERAATGRVCNAPKTDEPIGSDGFNALLKLIAALRVRREELGISQAELAERIRMEPSALCRLETFKAVNPTAWTLCNRAAALDYDLDFQLRPAKTPAAAR